MAEYPEGELNLDFSRLKIEKGACEMHSYPSGGGVVASFNTEMAMQDSGRQLCRWFYHELPEQIRQNQPLQYFAENVHLQCTYNIYGNNQLDCKGLTMSTWVLNGIFLDENLNFSPNLDFGGLKTQCDRFGILTVEVSGTVHRDNSCLGVFDHTFQVVRCPQKGVPMITSVKLNMMRP